MSRTLKKPKEVEKKIPRKKPRGKARATTELERRLAERKKRLAKEGYLSKIEGN